jgi:DNA-binding transcriptional LysR family regulator
MAAAARALGTTQPAVSQQVARLEREVGTPLVVRQARGTALTEAGTLLVAHADAVADRLDAARQDVAALAGLVAGTVRVAAFPTAAAIVLPPALAALRERAPALAVRFAELEPPEAERAVRDGDAGVGLVFRHALVPGAPPGDLLCEPLARDPVRLVLPAGRPAPDGLAELAGEPWIAGCPRCRAHLLRCAATAGSTPDVRLPPTTTSWSSGSSRTGSGWRCCPGGRCARRGTRAWRSPPHRGWTSASSRCWCARRPAGRRPWPRSPPRSAGRRRA